MVAEDDGSVIALRVAIRSPDLATFVAKYSRFVKDDRIFIFTKSSQPVGTRVRFLLELQDGRAILRGEGKVTRIREDHGDPQRPPGMELVFTPLDEASAELVERLHAERAARAVVGTGGAPATGPKGGREKVVSGWTPVPPPMNKHVRGAPALAAAVAAAPPPPPQPRRDAAPRLPFSDLPTKSGPALEAAEAQPTPTPPPRSPTSDHPATGDFDLEQVPAFAERWRPEAPDTGLLPANPFSEVSDGAIEYFVEWSLEQSTGRGAAAGKLPSASFENVTMTPPLPEAPPPMLRADAPIDAEELETLRGPRRAPMLYIGGGLGAGLALGAILVATLTSRHPNDPKPAANTIAMAGPAAVAPVASATPEPPAPSSRPAAAAAEPTKAGPTKAGPTELQISSRPAGADVVVDGKARGQTPVSVEVSEGQHQIELRKDRYQTASVHSIAPGELAVTLRRPIAMLRVKSTPSGARVTVGGEPRGSTPLTLRLPAYESYPVELELAGAVPWKHQVYMRNTTVDVAAAMVMKRQGPAAKSSGAAKPVAGSAAKPAAATSPKPSTTAGGAPSPLAAKQATTTAKPAKR